MELPIKLGVFFLTMMGILIILYAFISIAAIPGSSQLTTSPNEFFTLIAWISVGIAEIAVAWLLEKQLKKP